MITWYGATSRSKVTPELITNKDPSVSPDVLEISYFCKNQVKIRKSSAFARDSPRHDLLPAEKGKKLSGCCRTLPLSSKKCSVEEMKIPSLETKIFRKNARKKTATKSPEADSI